MVKYHCREGDKKLYLFRKITFCLYIVIYCLLCEKRLVQLANCSSQKNLVVIALRNSEDAMSIHDKSLGIVQEAVDPISRLSRVLILTAPLTATESTNHTVKPM